MDDLGRLQRGQTVTLDDGRVIEPSQVMNPSIPGHVCIMFIDDEHTQTDSVCLFSSCLWWWIVPPCNI